MGDYVMGLIDTLRSIYNEILFPLSGESLTDQSWRIQAGVKQIIDQEMPNTSKRATYPEYNIKGINVVDHLHVRNNANEENTPKEERKLIIYLPGNGMETHQCQEALKYANKSEKNPDVLVGNYSQYGYRIKDQGYPFGRQEALEYTEALYDQAVSEGYKPENITLMGRSMGGHLATIVAGDIYDDIHKNNQDTTKGPDVVLFNTLSHPKNFLGKIFNSLFKKLSKNEEEFNRNAGESYKKIPKDKRAAFNTIDDTVVHYNMSLHNSKDQHDNTQHYVKSGLYDMQIVSSENAKQLENQGDLDKNLMIAVYDKSSKDVTLFKWTGKYWFRCNNNEKLKLKDLPIPRKLRKNLEKRESLNEKIKFKNNRKNIKFMKKHHGHVKETHNTMSSDMHDRRLESVENTVLKFMDNPQPEARQQLHQSVQDYQSPNTNTSTNKNKKKQEHRPQQPQEKEKDIISVNELFSEGWLHESLHNRSHQQFLNDKELIHYPYSPRSISGDSDHSTNQHSHDNTPSPTSQHEKPITGSHSAHFNELKARNSNLNEESILSSLNDLEKEVKELEKQHMRLKNDLKENRAKPEDQDLSMGHNL